MKKISFLIILCFCAFVINAQIIITAGKQANKFFKSYEDYKAGKPIEGTVLNNWKSYSSSVEMTENGTQQKVKVGKLPCAWFCNSDGMLMRVFDGDLYYLVIDGPLCFYIKCSEGTIVGPNPASEYNISGKFSDSWPNEYYSETPNGPIEKLKEKVLDPYLENYNLASKYENDPAYKRERKDCVLCWQSKKTNKMIKYVRLVNEKIK